MIWLRVCIFTAALVLMTLVLLPVQLAALALDLPLSRRIPGIWHRGACRLMRIRIRVHGVRDDRRPLMIVANHASWKDILILGSLMDATFVAKTEVRDWPVFGVLARLQRSIFVERAERRAVGNQAGEIGARLNAGEIVVLFPEGTTSDGNRVLKFKSALFGAAAAAIAQTKDGVVHVQPVAIAYTGLHGMPMGRYHRPIAAWPGDIELLPHLYGVLKAGALEVDVCFCETVEFDASSDRKQVSALVESRVRRMHSDRVLGRP